MVSQHKAGDSKPSKDLSHEEAGSPDHASGFVSEAVALTDEPQNVSSLTESDEAASGIGSHMMVRRRLDTEQRGSLHDGARSVTAQHVAGQQFPEPLQHALADGIYNTIGFWALVSFLVLGALASFTYLAYLGWMI